VVKTPRNQRSVLPKGSGKECLGKLPGRDGFNPPVKSLPSRAPLLQRCPSSPVPANGKVEEVVFSSRGRQSPGPIAVKRPAGSWRRRRAQVCGNSGAGEQIKQAAHSIAMILQGRIPDEINKLSPTDRAAAKQSMMSARSF